MLSNQHPKLFNVGLAHYSTLSLVFKNISSYHVQMCTGADTIHQLCFYPVKRFNACTRLCEDTGAHNWQLLSI